MRGREQVLPRAAEAKILLKAMVLQDQCDAIANGVYCKVWDDDPECAGFSGRARISLVPAEAQRVLGKSRRAGEGHVPYLI